MFRYPAEPQEIGRYRNWIGELRAFYVQNGIAYLCVKCALL